MKKQVIVLHGGRTFKTYREYKHSLLSRKLTADNFKVKADWRSSLNQKLGKHFEVFVPKMPNPNNAVYEEWKIWFERMHPFLHHNVILVGHSLGGIFLAKYLSETTYKKKIKAVILVAAPFEDCTDEPLGDFIIPKSMKKFSHQAKNIYIVHSKDDPIVPFTETKKYKKALLNATIISFHKKQHFNQEFFPEIVKLIKEL